MARLGVDFMFFELIWRYKSDVLKRVDIECRQRNRKVMQKWFVKEQISHGWERSIYTRFGRIL